MYIKINGLIAWLSLYLLCCNAVELEGPVDLSWPYDETARECPGDQDFEILKHYENKEGTWYALNTFAVAEHCGTHIDAPAHFNPDGITLEKIPLQKLLVTGVYIDVSKETGDNANYTMPLSKVIEWEKINGLLPENSVVLVNFGWSSRYADKDKYLGKSKAGYSHPGVSPEASQYLIDSKKVVGIGVDCSSVDPGYDAVAQSHIILSKAEMYILENVALTSPLPPVFKLIVAPMKISKGTGGPTRLFALPTNYKF